jgi:hypothetical protein
VLDEWNEAAEQVEPLAPYFPGRVGRQWVLDLTTHEHDLRHALGTPGARESEGVDISAEFVVEVGFLTGAAVRGVPPIELQVGDRSWIAGTGVPAAADSPDGLERKVTEAAGAVLTGGDPPTSEASPEAVLKIEPFELFRAMTGRRSIEQIKAYAWSADPAPYLPLFQFGPFTTRADALDE